MLYICFVRDSESKLESTGKESGGKELLHDGVDDDVPSAGWLVQMNQEYSCQKK
jgi:hypothetical protein